MAPEQIKTDINLETVQDNLPLSIIWREALKQIPILTRILSVVFALAFAYLTIHVALLWSNDGQDGASGSVQVVVFIFFMSIAIAGMIAGPILQGVRRARTMLRATSFAQANGFMFSNKQKDPTYPGVIFSQGSEREASSVLQGSYQGRDFTVFNYFYVVGSGKSRTEYRKGIISVKLPRRLPNVIFDSRANDILGISSLGTTFKRSESFTFEGDFNKHFNVYAPSDYGRDVLYFMTPELMALLIDEAGNYDIEVVDDNLFFYAPEFKYTKDQLGGIFKIISNIGGEFSENTRRYADERVGDKTSNTIAASGRRLKKSISWITVSVIIIYVVLTMLSWTNDG